MSTKQLKGFFSFDAAIASLLLISIIFIGIFVFKTQINNLSSSMKIAKKERIALTVSDYLVREAPPDGVCRVVGNMVEAKVVDDEKINEQLAEKIKTKFGIAHLKILVNNLAGENKIDVGDEGDICIRRLVSNLENEGEILEVCV